ncbi:MAG: hypothetical protein QNJ51_26100 [Calothrix sp. MO_167.B12]|nr:hypothetical protein [Calothrix sp. MO_167.B12]
MHKQNPSKGSKRNKWNFYSSYPWFPYPSAWIKSLILVVIMGFISRTFAPIKILEFIATSTQSPEITTFFLIFTLILPIAAIALTHHCLHLVINQLAPSIQAPEIGKIEGFLPNIISWWEGLYGWSVIILSSLLGVSICIFLFPIFNLNFSIDVNNYNSFQNNIIGIFGTVWIINAALLYHFEYQVKQIIISVYSQNR